MFYIFFSIVTNDCFIFLFKDNLLIARVNENDAMLHSENFVRRVNNVVRENCLSLKNLEEIYFILDPNEQQTSNRVSSSFVTAMTIMSENIKVFSIDSFEFQKGRLKNCLSVISFGKSLKKYWLNCYEDNKLLYRKKLSSFEEIRILNEKKKFQVICDFENVDFSTNFFFLKNNFKRFEV